MKREADPGLSKALQADLRELDQGMPLTRHPWLQEVLDDPAIGPNAYGQNPPRDVVLRAMLTRMSELTSVWPGSERDMELEAATVALGFRFTSGPDMDGSRYVYEWVRANEVYEDLRGDWQAYHGVPPRIVRSDIVGIGGIYAGYALGNQWDGIGEGNSDRWFMSFIASGVRVHIPFDAITEVVDKSTQTYTYTFNGHENVAHYGSVIESPTIRLGMSRHGWLQREAV